MKNAELSKWLQRMRVPLVLWIRDGSRLEVLRPDDIRAHPEDGTIEVAAQDGWQQVLLEDVLDVGFQPQATPPERRM